MLIWYLAIVNATIPSRFDSSRIMQSYNDKTLYVLLVRNIWIKAFKNGPSKICRRQSLKNLSDMVCLSRPNHFKLFKGCLPQILLDPSILIVSILFPIHISKNSLKIHLIPEREDFRRSNKLNLIFLTFENRTRAVMKDAFLFLCG